VKTFTVHMPPPSGSAETDALETIFVREGFAFWAFVFPFIWLIINGMWWVLLGYCVVTGVLEGASLLIGEIAPGVMLVLTAFLFGLEANQLRRWTLDRNGYRFVGIAAGRRQADAEQRFFDSWPQHAAPGGSFSASRAGPAGRPKIGSGLGERPVTGLFPQAERPR